MVLKFSQIGETQILKNFIKGNNDYTPYNHHIPNMDALNSDHVWVSLLRAWIFGISALVMSNH